MNEGQPCPPIKGQRPS